MKTKVKKATENVVEQTTQKYILDRTMHFGSIKTTFKIGSVFEINRDDRMMRVDGVKFEDIRDAETCIRHGWMLPYNEKEQKKIDVMAKTLDKAIETRFARTKPAKMEIIKSDTDLMERVITIPENHRERQKREASEKVKQNSLKVIGETEGDSIRGLKVYRQSDDADIARQLNAEHLGTPLNKTVKVANGKKNSEVEKQLMDRKIQIEKAKRLGK